METEFGAAERDLLAGDAGALFREAVEAGGIAGDDRRLGQRSQSRPAFDLLLTLGLLVHDAENDRFLPVDPDAVTSRVVTPLGREALDLIAESQRWATTFHDLASDFRRVTSLRTPFRELRGVNQINGFLTAAIDDARMELLTAQPTVGRNAHALQRAARRDISAVKRGVSMRTLYQHTARRSTEIQEYVETISEHGAMVRTIDEFFNRLIVVDRQVAVIPGQDPGQIAMAIHELSLVAYLVDIFERYWQRATPFDDRHEATAKGIASDVRNMTTRMLREGQSDIAGAKRVGVSVRTYADYVARLKDEYGVNTRFQLGYAMGQEDSRDHEVY